MEDRNYRLKEWPWEADPSFHRPIGVKRPRLEEEWNMKVILP